MRFIDADELLNRLPDDLPYKASVKRVLMQAPSADVAPKKEFAKEIFEEIEKLHLNFSSQYDAVLFAELKKKYTEENR